MNYGELLSRAWNTIWDHKFLILLGVLVALGGGGGGGASTGGNLTFNQPRGEMPRMPEIPRIPEIPDPRAIAPALVIVVIIAIIAAVLIGLALWVVSTIARGGLIAGASTIDDGGSSSFAQAWNAGWRKGWRLLGIGILPAIPGFLLVIMGVGAAVAFGGVSRYLGRDVGVPAITNLGILLVALSCILVPIAVILGLLRTFANRACILEDQGVFGAYRRGLQVLLDNFGPAVILFLIQIGITIAIGVVSFLPALCCVLWPLLIVLQGGIAAYFSTLWTLAWRDWTGLTGAAATPHQEELAVG
jgi:hypothetical protein